MNSKAVILAGGVGKRFWPILTHKPLFPFCGKPIFMYTLEALQNAGFSEVVIVVNPKDEETVRGYVRGKKTVEICLQRQAGGMADAMLSAERQLQGHGALIVNAEDLVEPHLFLEAFKAAEKGAAFLIAKKVQGYFEGGYLAFKDGKLAGIIEKPREGRQPSDLVNLVFHYFPSADLFLALLKKMQSTTDDVYEKALTQYIHKHEVNVIRYNGYWQPLKFPWHVIEMATLFLNQRSVPGNHASFIAKSAHVDANVNLGRGVRVLEHTVIKGPSWVGDNVIIGTSSLILESMIEEGSVVGFASEVTRSYIGAKSWLHRNYVGDSVLEGENYLGAGAVTANFRFDEAEIRTRILRKEVNTHRRKLGAVLGKGARLGVNASLMPGVKIGHHAIVGPGVVQYTDLEERNSNTKSRKKQ